MPVNKSFAFRLEVLDECLRNNLTKWTLQKLIDKVNEKLEDRYNQTASKRSIQADISHLINDKNAPIQKKRDGNQTYYFYSERDFSIKNLPIKEEEVNYLKDAIYVLRQVSDFKILDTVDEIVSKLENTINNNVVGSTTIIQFEKHTTALGTQYIDDLFTAIKEKNTLLIFYQPFDKQVTEHLFHPYLLREYRNRWFLIGRSRLSTTKVTTLALDRIQKIKNAKEQYLTNDLFDPDTYFNNLIGVTFPENAVVEEVIVKVGKKQAAYVRTKPIHHTQEIQKTYKDGCLLLSMQLVCNYELKAVLLGYGADIEVMKPEKLRENMKVDAESMSKIYTSARK